MKFSTLGAACLVTLGAAAVSSESDTPMSSPPVAARKPHAAVYHGVTLEDPYFWLRDPAYPDVKDREILGYLEAENDYFKRATANERPLVERIFAELKAREVPDDASVPWKDRDYMYRWRYADGDAQYRVWSRWPVGRPDAEQVFLDEPKLAAGSEYFKVGDLAVSPSGRYLAYSVDTSGSERLTLRVKDLATGALLPDTIANTGGSIAWGNDDATLFYTLLTDNWRPYVAKRHRLGTLVADDAVVYQEKGDFFVGVGKTQSDRYILITAGDHVTSEIRFVPADAPEAAPTLIEPRRANHEYDVDHHGDDFYIRTNDQHANFRLARAPIAHPSEANWQTVIAGSDSHYLTGHTCFADFIAIEDRVEGLDQIRIRDYAGNEHDVALPEASYDAGLGTNAEYAVTKLRLNYESMVTPQTVYDYDVAERTLETLKVRIVPSGYDPRAYATERIAVRARDGASVPVSLVYKKTTLDPQRNGTAPMLLYGYGAYGLAMTPYFSAARLSLLDRGMVYAIAHVRGGDELGFHWYEDGKLDKRTNTFHDFVDVARGLIAERYTAPGRIAIMGGSAGGTLVGAVLNDAPELWGAAVAQVPFVDVLNTILDGDLPLTPLEWPEWGNPIRDASAFERIRSWSPYDQIGRHAYPPMLVTAGLNDPRVTYWEAAKYVAKLRHEKTDQNLLVLKTEMGAGHGGKSGRYDSLEETAEAYAFILASLGIAEASPTAP